jgi:sigma-B regulation protein RsbU (phosphoserine phosphatase)
VLRQEGDVERLGTGGMPIGLLEDARYDTFEFRLRSGDKLLLYSDGLTECPLAVGGFLEEDGLIALCRKHGMARGEDMISRMAGDLVRMSGAVDFPDDASALLVEYDGSGR